MTAASHAILDPPAVAEVAHVVALPKAVAPVLAVGAFLKTTVCVACGDEALVSGDVGNLDSAASIGRFEDAVDRLLDRLEGPPVAVAHDLHPDFHSTRFAQDLARRLDIDAVPVQHHHAHVASIMAEHGRFGPTLGLALDGFGLGERRESWGGELLRVDADGYRRLGHLTPLAQPGGDKAAREPWRMACAALHALGRHDEIANRFREFDGSAVIARMLAKGVNTPPTSSAGRLFDAACGLLGVKPVATFEGEAPMALERLAAAAPADVPAMADGWRLSGGVLDMTPLLSRLADMDPGAGAALFHATFAEALATWVASAADATDIPCVALGGGCFFNEVLTARLVEALSLRNIACLRPIALGPGDPAISLGQAWAAALARSSS